MADLAPLLPQAVQSSSPSTRNQLNSEASVLTKLISRTKQIPILEWTSVPFFGGLGVLFSCGYERTASVARYILLTLLAGTVLEMKQRAVMPLSDIGIDLYSDAVKSVLNGATDCKGRAIATLTAHVPYQANCVHGYCAKRLSAWVPCKALTNPLAVPTLLLMTSITTLVEQAQTAFTLPSLFAAQCKVGAVASDNPAFVLLVIVIVNLLMHMFLFLQFLEGSKAMVEALPGLQARFDPMRPMIGVVDFEQEGREKEETIEGTCFCLTRREAEYLSRNFIWRRIRDAAFQGNLMVVADVCSQVLKRTAKELPRTVVLKRSREQNRSIVGEKACYDYVLCCDANIISSSHGSGSFTRIVFRMGTSSLPRVIIKLYCLDSTWADLDQAGRSNLFVAVSITTMTMLLAVPDMVSEALKVKKNQIITTVLAQPCPYLKVTTGLVMLLMMIFFVMFLLIMILLKHTFSFGKPFGFMFLDAVGLGLTFAAGAYALIIFLA